MKLTRQRFWFLRHGETDWNARGLSQGNVDIPLNATGIAQAQAAAPLLVGRGIASIVASPLSRAHDTARAAAEVLGLPVELDEGLRETSFGAQEGQPMVDWFADWVDGTYTPPDAESFAMLRARALAAVNRALTRPGLVLVVAHGALFRALRAEMGLAPNVRTRNAWPMLCEPGEPWTLTDAA
ncbi:MAG: histidine phosphatase family protein [Acetobacteraceae bacterium]|nr:histidine phosphatase family protein [Acetobacteraceae bacterium]